MSTQAIHIRARTPPPQHLADEEAHHTRRLSGIGSRRWGQSEQSEASDWDASTGSVEARNRLRLSKARFVREGKKSRQWTGNWVQPSEESAAKVEDGAEHVVQSDTVLQDPPQPLQPVITSGSDTQATGTMASFYAQLAANLKASSATSAPSSRTLSNIAAASNPAARSAMQPRSVVHKSRSEGRGQSKRSTADWFSDRPRLPKTSARLISVKGSASEHEPTQSHQEGPVPINATLTPCPTCSTPLPYPCPPSVLRSHLSSIAHRLALPHIPPGPSSSTPPPTGLSEQGRKTKLHLDEANRGYRLLSEMGWREGMGVGRSEWEWEEGQREREQSRMMQEAAEKRKEAEDLRAIKLEAAAERKPSPGQVLVISSDEDEEEGADDFEALAHLDSVDGDGIDDVFRLPSPTPPQEQRNQSGAAQLGEEQRDDQVPPTAQRPEPRLVPISISQKHDRAGLGRKLPSSSSSSSIASALKRGKERKDGTEALFTLKKREREVRDRQEREERIAIRDSLR